MTGLVRTLALAGALTLLVGCGRGRWPGDWHLRVACLGDSNSFLAMEVNAAPSWCEYLTDLGADRWWTTANLSWFGASAVDTAMKSGDISLSATDWVQKAIDDPFDVAILSYGTNDIRRGLAPDEIVTAILRHRTRLERAGVEVYVTTIPLLYRPAETDRNPRIDDFNAALRAAIPPDHLIDFRAHESEDDFRYDQTRLPVRDGVHINEAAQRRRAQLVYEALHR